MPIDYSQFYQFRSSAGNSVIMRRGFDAPKITSGGARWVTTPRPRRRSITTWDGTDPYKMDVSVLFDGWRSNNDVEADIAKLNQMKISPDLISPPTVFIDGAVPVKGATWVIEDIQWGDNVIYNQTTGNRLRQDAVVQLLQFVGETRLTINKNNASASPYTVKAGDTMASISKKNYGDTQHQKIIMRANNIRDPKNIHPGQVLKIPRVSK